MSPTLLVTADLEIAPDHDGAAQAQVLDALRTDLGALGLPVTFFATADAAERFAPQVERLRAAGHEIACHGRSHDEHEDFSRMPEREVAVTLAEATRRIESVTRRRPLCFRGPRMTSSAVTQRVLVETGYVADFSVCSQRLDFLGCRGGSPAWLTAPRRPYFPSERSPFRRGRVPLHVVPLSCLGMPFLSGVLYLAGLRFMRAFFQVLLAEARRTQKPIVYLFHPYEFSAARRPTGDRTRRSKRLHRLYRQDRERRYANTLRLLETMAAVQDVQPRTAAAYVSGLPREAG